MISHKLRTWLLFVFAIIENCAFLSPLFSAEPHPYPYPEELGTYEVSPQLFGEFEILASRGDVIAQRKLGICYYWGCGTGKDYLLASKWLGEAAVQGDAIAQRRLGVCYENGNGVEKNLYEAVKWYRKAAEQGNAIAQLNLGNCYCNGTGVEKNPYEAVKWYRKATEQGNADAQLNLGVCYYDGIGVEKNTYEAVKWFYKAAEQGNANAQLNLGVCYSNGTGVEKNLYEAVKWYFKAAEQGNATAQLNLGFCYKYGHGVESNPYEATKWFRKAAEQGNARAQYNLGKKLLGIVVTRSFNFDTQDFEEEGVEWLKKAAEKGLIPAMTTLADDYRIWADYYGYKVQTEYYKKTNNSSLSQEAREEGRKHFLKKAQYWAECASRQQQKELLALSSTDTKNTSELEADIPQNPQTATDTFVCIIANEDYSRTNVANTKFAQHDGALFAEYANKVLGVPEKNIKIVSNATLGLMRSTERWLKLHVEQHPSANVIYYYAGHGVPIINDGKIEKKCLLPTDVAVEDAEIAGIDVDLLLERLSQLNATRVVVFLDTCFSGTTREDQVQVSARGVRISATPTAPRGNMVVFAAASGDQTALPSKTATHGIFTKSLLTKLRESKGNCTYSELAESLKKTVAEEALRQYGKEQTPTIQASGNFNMEQKLYK